MDFRVSQFGSQGGGIGQLNSPFGVAVNSLGSVFVTDNVGSRTQKFDSNGTFLSIATGYGYGIAVDSSDNLFTSTASSVKKFGSSGNFLGEFGSFGSGDGQVQYPQGIAVDAFGNIFVADTLNGRIQAFDSSGNYLTQINGVNLVGLTIVSNKLYASNNSIGSVQVYDINANSVPFDFSPNFGFGILGAVFVTKKLIKKNVVKQKVSPLGLMMKRGK